MTYNSVSGGPVGRLVRNSLAGWPGGLPRVCAAGALATALSAVVALPAFAHHPFGGEVPQTLWAGIFSGVAHPLLGIDHLVFVIAVGLLAAMMRRGVWVPATFLLAALAGTGIHLAELNLPAPEVIVSGSVLLFGLLVVAHQRLNVTAIAVITFLAGIFHGYAYGEAIVGSEPTPMVAYLVGFTLVQGAIAFLACLVANRAANATQVRHAGFAIFGAGVALLSGLVL